MKVVYVKEKRPNDYHNPYFTHGKEYNVLADYRLRNLDNGFVIKDDMNQERMVYEGDFNISDNKIKNTYVFSYNY